MSAKGMVDDERPRSGQHTGIVLNANVEVYCRKVRLDSVGLLRIDRDDSVSRKIVGRSSSALEVV